MSASLRAEEQDRFEKDVARFIEYLEGVRNLSQNTVRAYETDLAAYCAWARLEGVVGYDASHRELRRYLAYMTKAGYTTRTVNRHLSAIRGLYKWLVSQDVTRQDAAAALASPKIAKTLPRTMVDADVSSLLATCDKGSAEGLRDAAFIELLYATGARISELSRLDKEAIQFDLAEVKLFGKGSKERTVPLYQQVLHVMDEYLRLSRPQLVAKKRRGDPTPALFVSTRGNRMSADALRTCFERHVALAGLDGDITPHAMRHTYATELLSGGADLRSVQELLGHESLATTQIYTHLSVERLKEATRQAHPRGE